MIIGIKNGTKIHNIMDFSELWASFWVITKKEVRKDENIKTLNNGYITFSVP